MTPPDARSDPEFAGSPDFLLAAELQPGEKLVWVGQPRAGRLAARLLPLGAVGLLFLVIWAGILTGLPPGALGGKGQWFDLIMPAILVVGLGTVGVVASSSPFWTYLRAKRIVYALTNRRALILEPFFPAGIQVRSYDPDRLRSLERRDHSRGGRGSLIFEHYIAQTQYQIQTTVRRGWLQLDDARAVENLLRSTLFGPAEPAPSPARSTR